MLKLNLGCGTNPLEGYENEDISKGQLAFPLNHPDGSADEIRASHLLEHFSYTKAAEVLKDWYRVLKPGGTIRLSVPDFELLAKLYCEKRTGRMNFQGFVLGGHCDENDYHKTLWDEAGLTDALEQAGFIDVQPWESQDKDTSCANISLNLKALKPVPFEGRVRAVMSVPRLGFMANFYCWSEALLPYGIAPTTCEGAFWGQCLERTMDAAKDDCDWVLTIDYDSFFTRYDVRKLLLIAQNHPEIDALAPIQMKRGNDTSPLLTINGPDGKLLSQVNSKLFAPPTVSVDTAHFGLTLLRASKLKELPHPWFIGTPGADGKWGDDRIDDDIYFWRKWKQAGNSIHVATHCVIGHGEYTVLLPDEKFNPIHQGTSDWKQNGPPANVWR